jgi:predicted transposase YdaD
MKNDKIFYTLFQVFPKLIFQLIGEPPNVSQSFITHIRHHKVPQREVTGTKNPREHKKKHMQ